MSVRLVALRWPSVLLLWLLVAAGDFVTTAEVAFTLLYLAPVGLAVWNLGPRAGAALAVLSTSSSFATWMASGAWSRPVIVWNLACELGVFLVFVLVLERLRRRVESEARGRESAVAQLRHADRLGTIGKLAAGVAHELGTPLNVVAARARLVVERRSSPDDVARSATVIAEQAERMSEIIKGLLAFSRRGATSKAPTDLGRLVRETAELLGPTARARGVELALRDAGLAVAPVNANEIQQVVGNLVVNAVQAMSGGGHVWLSAKEEGSSSGPIVRLRVEDDGPGIPPEVLPHVFDPFFTTKDVGEGTGLGLAVAFGIVQDHGGYFEIGTAVGKGTRFDVCLPADDRHPAGS